MSDTNKDVKIMREVGLTTSAVCILQNLPLQAMNADLSSSAFKAYDWTYEEMKRSEWEYEKRVRRLMREKGWVEEFAYPGSVSKCELCVL